MFKSGIDVISVFDGYGGARVALDRLGIKVRNYYSLEIDKWCNTILNKNYPDAVQLGDVTQLPGWLLPRVDLLIGGSPCQGFSFAGKQLNFDDPRSKLFFEFVRIKNKNNPKYFLLENVRMKKEYQDVISNHLGVEPIEINSALVSAQNRKRLYWTNIPMVTQPEDKNILLKHILHDNEEKIGAMRGRYLVDGVRQDHKMKTAGRTTQQLEIRKDFKSNTLTSVQKDNYVIKNNWRKWFDKNAEEKIRKKYISLDPDKAITMTARQYASWNGNFIKIHKRGSKKRDQHKSSTLTAGANSAGKHSDMDLILTNTDIRRLTPIECERLQTLPDNYTEGVSDSQRYKMLGNGFTVDVITHILSHGNFFK